MNCRQPETLEVSLHKVIVRVLGLVQREPFSPWVDGENGYDHPFHIEITRYNFHQETQVAEKQAYAQFLPRQWYLPWLQLLCQEVQ